MARENYRFSITPVGGQISKADRIRALLPLFESHRIYLPDHCIHQDYRQTQVDTSKLFLEEMRTFPFGAHDDMLDCLARILDPAANFARPRPSPHSQAGKQKTTDSNYDPLAPQTAPTGFPKHLPYAPLDSPQGRVYDVSTKFI